jgi:cytoplasmic iron level regulating protein YaaA (DUF328/UPF0246 family)
MNPKGLGDLMSISDKLADLNWSRFQNWKSLKNNSDAIQPVFSFTGEVFKGLEASSMNQQELLIAQDSIRVLSGLYGLLKPLDGISPYRLEMGTKFNATDSSSNLYEFWGEKITNCLSEELKPNDVVINLASKEYSRVIHFKKITHTVVSPLFKDYKNGKLKTIMMYAKKARGSMARYIVQNRLNSLEDLKNFNVDNYVFDQNLSNDKEWVFTR